MKRRLLLTQAAAIAGALPLAARAQPARVPRVGFLIVGDAEPSWSLLRKAMTDLGYVEGRTVHYEFRSSTVDRERLAADAASLVSANVDVIVAVLTPAVLAAMRATTKIPIIFNGGLPESGIIKNVARPEGNATGIYGATAVIAGKSVQLFRELKPSTRTIAVLLNAPDPFNVTLRREIETSGKAQGIEVVPVMLTGPQELATAFESLAKRGVDGVAIQPSLPVREAAALAVRHGLPALSYRREFAEAGGLLSYGAHQPELFRLMASYTDRVLKGAQTADLPVQMTTRFELIVNQKTAKALGLALSPMFLGRVDEVIE